MLRRFKNSTGTVWYGMHMYPGVAEYSNDGKPFRVLINESSVKKLDPSFAGKPVFVQHKDSDEIHPDIDELRKEVDGWVLESFYNSADGKHWVKFLVCSKAAERAIRDGYRLSNCYAPLIKETGGTYNGVSYQREVVGGEYEHLAIVRDPRYEESVILSPEEFKAYNSEKTAEIQRLTNNKGKQPMKLKFFKREAIKNSSDLNLENMSVLLPKSNKEKSLMKLVNEADEREVARGKPALVDLSGLVEYGDEEITVEELLSRHQAILEELEEIKDQIEEVEEDVEDEDDELEDFENESDEDDDNEDFENEVDEEPKKKVAAKKPIVAKAKEDVKPKAKFAMKNKKLKNQKSDAEREEGRRKAKTLKNAGDKGFVVTASGRVLTNADRLQIGKSRYGSGS